MTITIPDAMANKITSAYGRAIAMAKQEKTISSLRGEAIEFIRILPPNHQESCEWLLNETIHIWSEPK